MMGTKSSRSHHHQRGTTPPPATTTPTEWDRPSPTQPQPPGSAQQQQQQGPAAPRIVAVPPPYTADLLIAGQNQELLQAVVTELPFQCQSHWKLLFSTMIHGRSFTHMVDRICGQGPTLVFVREDAEALARQHSSSSAADGGTGAGSPRILGGYCRQSWLNSQDRDKAAVSFAASQARAKRTGQPAPPGGRPKNQAPQFFGDDNCFVFTSETASGGGPSVYRARNRLNSNFMYLFEKHPDEERVGIAMGGQVNYHAWFLDSWLEKGYCKGTTCTSFGNPALCPREEFPVGDVEVYAIDDTTFDVEEEEATTTAASPALTKSQLLSSGNPKTNPDMVIMELHGHKFHSKDILSASQEQEGGKESGSSSSASP